MNAKAQCLLSVLAALTLTSLRSVAQLPEPNGGAIDRGVLPDRWMTGGPRCMEMPEWQVHEYNSNLYILRQSGCTDFEKPFVFLLFGDDKALLLDTGSRNGDLAPTLQRTIHNWLKMNSRQAIALIVVHTHGHEDHIAGDAAIRGLHDPAMPLTFVPAEVQADRDFFRMNRWPEDTGAVDLGDRIIDVIAIPGHSDTSIALYDRRTAILFAGDSLYPGRLYVHDLAEFQASTERMIRFTEGKPVAHILGNHIEQTRTPYLDYPVGTIYQPDEHELQLSPSNASERAAREKTFQETQRRQLDHMWDQK